MPLGPIFRREGVFRGIKIEFVSDKTLLYCKKSDHNGLNYNW